jgi:TolB protein
MRVALIVAALACLGFGLASVADGRQGVSAAQNRDPETYLISKSYDGHTPNGPSTNAAISGDRRYARVIAFESEASDLVRGDTNGVKDVFAVLRTGSVNNNGTKWTGGDAVLVSKTASGEPADGQSFDPSVSGDFRHDGGCIAFLSDATNLVGGDTNGVTDAFVTERAGVDPVRVSLPGGKESLDKTTAVTVSGDCSRVAFVTGGKLYTRVGNSVKGVKASGTVSDPSFATGDSNDLVFAASGGVYLSAGGTGKPKLVGRGGTNPTYNDLKRKTLAYEKRRGSYTQIYYGDLGKSARVISKRGKKVGNKSSRNPVIANSGFYVMFESDATNLSVNASNQTGDSNRATDSYLFTDSRDLTIRESVSSSGGQLPGGGANPSMNYYANYFVFDSPGPDGGRAGDHQIYLRYVGGI